MIPDLSLLWLALFGAWVAADGTSFGQFMVSRPFVAAAVAGLIVGDPAAGAMVGVMLEAFHLGVLPVGAARYPEAGPASVVAGAVYAGSDRSPGTLLLVVGFALVWAWLGGHSLHHLRQFNVGFVASRLGGGASVLERRHVAAIALDGARGALLVTVGVGALTAVVRLLGPVWGLDDRTTWLLTGAILVALVASTFRSFGARLPWYVCGAAAGLLFVALAR